MNKAIADVTAERIRQVQEEGYNSVHDDEHSDGSLVMAACSYALRTTGADDNLAHDLWPWDDCYYKPRDVRRDLVRAAALIIAEIERFDRLPKTTANTDKGKR